ncbi:MAG: DUF2917 domain-containing protein [Comamonas sp.]|nr:DUF2917 domain-containing protein [Comamonas sp.]
MNSPAFTLLLQPAAPVQTLDIAPGRALWLEALTGLTWLTREGLLEDFFLEAGRHMRINGPARLYLGAQGHRAASLRWSYAPGTALSSGPCHEPGGPDRPRKRPDTVGPA